MYIHKDFVEHDPARVSDFVRHHPFGTLVTWDGEKPVASHLLMLLKGSAGEPQQLIGHMARVNPQWKSFQPGQEVLAIFQGAHTYVSASWYSVPSAPTWNYTSVHVYGTPSVVSDRRELYELLRELVDSQEAGTPEAHRYRLENLLEDLRESMMNGIVGFRVQVARVEAAAKMSQNRSEADHARIIEKLRQRPDGDSHSVADEMERRGRGR
ncbi:MAG TPA: FMN-binding negative transcriptional regulator [Spirochaetia bacterium]|nr:FMN-binding negative transcriptional regulator [Spirochaetia bacterium]